MTTRNKQISIGDRVAYSANFLRSTGMVAGEIGHWRGKVVALITFGSGSLATIEWDHGEFGKVLDANLARVGSPEMSAN